jgi:tetratricopeptide (TPR) repeat protein
MGFLQQARQVYEELVRERPGENDYHFNVSATNLEIAQLWRETGRPDLARESFLKAIESAERLARQHPHVILVKALLAQSLSGLAELLGYEGDKAAALERLRHAIAITEGIVSGNPQLLRHRRDLSHELDSLGNFQRDLGQLDEARRSYGESLRMLDELESSDPYREFLRRLRARALTDLGTLERVAGRPGAALRTLRQALSIIDGIAEPDGSLFCDQACAESQLFALADNSAGDFLPADRADCLAAGERAMASLRRAVATGFQDTARLRGEIELEPIRRRSDFQSLLGDLSFPPDPFAP